LAEEAGEGERPLMFHEMKGGGEKGGGEEAIEGRRAGRRGEN
jgi:hypothetical protein